MVNKGLDTAFLHFGIRDSDLKVIEEICNDTGLDFEWVKEAILKQFHEHKTKESNVDEKIIEKLIEKALSKLPNY